jgi:hypothetical protein
MLVLGAFAHVTKARMVAILLATSGIPAGRLKVSVGEGTNPHVGPGGRDGERPYASQEARIGKSAAVRTQVCEALA